MQGRIGIEFQKVLPIRITVDETLELTEANYNEVSLNGKDNALVVMNELQFVSGSVTVGTASNIKFKTADGTEVTLRTDKYMDDASEEALAAVVAGLKAGDIVNLKDIVLGWYNGPQLTPFSAESIEVVSSSTPEPEQPGTNPEQPGTNPEQPGTNPEQPVEGLVQLDFVSGFSKYAAEWLETYGEQTVVNTDLGSSVEFEVLFTRADKQRAGNSIDDRPVIAAKESTEYRKHAYCITVIRHALQQLLGFVFRPEPRKRVF